MTISDRPSAHGRGRGHKLSGLAPFRRAGAAAAMLAAAVAMTFDPGPLVFAQGRPAAPSARPVPSQSAQTLRPIVVQAGAVARVPALGPSSPYYSAQVGGAASKPVTFTFVEVDYYRHATNEGGPANDNLAPAFVGVEQAGVVIDRGAKDFPVGFRYATAEKNLTGALWQISRYPFANDPTHWQGQYIPGLVASGEVVETQVDGNGYHYFRINFARAANRDPGERPYFDGTLALAPPGGGAPVLGPSAASAARERAIPAPSGPTRQPIMPAAPGRQQAVMPAPRAIGALSRGAESVLTLPDMDQVYYVRVVPMHAGNQAGIPAIPVVVTVKRPHPCPTVTADLVVRPPSARVVWYMAPNFFDSADAQGRWYAVATTTFMPKGAHSNDLVPPMQNEERAWYEKVMSTFTDMVDFFSDVMTNVSMMWNGLEDQLVQLTATAISYTTTGGLYRCDKDPNCTGMLKAVAQSVMAAYGIPPTLPTGPELLDMSTDYLIRLGAEEVGATTLYEAYQGLPSEVKQQMQSGRQRFRRR